MAQSITLTINDDITANYLFDGIAQKWNYQVEIDGQPNPESKKEFITRLLGNFLKSESIQGYVQIYEQTERGSIESIEIIGT